MKTGIPILVLILAITISLCGCGSGSSWSSGPSTKEQLAQAKEELRDVQKQLAGTQKELEKRQREIGTLQKEVENQRQRADTAEAGKQRYGLVLLFVALSIVGFGGWLFFPRKVDCSPSDLSASGRPKCPRCGWEHDPSDTICKNPDCKTQF